MAISGSFYSRKSFKPLGREDNKRLLIPIHPQGPGGCFRVSLCSYFELRLFNWSICSCPGPSLFTPYHVFFDGETEFGHTSGSNLQSFIAADAVATREDWTVSVRLYQDLGAMEPSLSEGSWFASSCLVHLLLAVSQRMPHEFSQGTRAISITILTHQLQALHSHQCTGAQKDSCFVHWGPRFMPYSRNSRIPVSAH